jgi:hypothetical protein
MTEKSGKTSLFNMQKNCHVCAYVLSSFVLTLVYFLFHKHEGTFATVNASRSSTAKSSRSATVIGLASNSSFQMHPGLVYLPHLPLLSLKPAGTRWKSPSTADKSGGSADRGFISYANGTKLVVADYFGPGMIFWMWVTHDGAKELYDVWAKKCVWTIEIDGKPYLEFIMDDMCGGSPKGRAFPFVPPYNEKIGNKDFLSDGCWFHLPAVFEHRVRLYKERFEDEYPRTGPLGGDYVSLQISLFPPSTNVSKWSMLPLSWYDENRDVFAKSWGSRTSALDDCSLLNISSICDKDAQRFDFSSVSGQDPQVVCINCSGAVTSVTCIKSRSKSTDRIKIYFDEPNNGPQVEVTFSDFFAYYEDGAALGSMWHGQKSNDVLFFALPMPFWRSLAISVQSDSSCSLEFVLGDFYAQDETGHFHLKTTNEEASPARGATVLRTSNAGGHVVMTSVRLNQPSRYMQWYSQRALESDFLIHENGRMSTSSFSSSYEDFFFCPNGFGRGLVGLPHIGIQLHYDYTSAGPIPSWCPGRPMELDPTCPGLNSEVFLHGYRLLAPDVIPFESSLIIALEHGSESIRNQVSCNIQAATGWYGKQYPLMDLVLQFDSFQALRSKSHHYRVDSYFQAKNVTGTFMSVDGGPYDFTEFTFTALFVPTQSSFGCTIDPRNGGVILRRTAVYHAGQRSNVYVNEQFVGSWESMESNSFFAFNEFEFVIDQKFTAGYDYLMFRFDVLPPPSTRPSLRWDFFPDAFPMMSPQALHPSMCTWNEIKWEVFKLAVR